MNATDPTAAAVEAAARAYYGVQSLEFPPDDAELVARFRASWDEGRVRPEMMEKCRKAVRPLVLDALEAYRAAGQ